MLIILLLYYHNMKLNYIMFTTASVPLHDLTPTTSTTTTTNSSLQYQATLSKHSCIRSFSSPVYFRSSLSNQPKKFLSILPYHILFIMAQDGWPRRTIFGNLSSIISVLDDILPSDHLHLQFSVYMPPLQNKTRPCWFT